MHGYHRNLEIRFEQKEDLIDRLDRVLEWIRSCDTKSSILLAGIGLVLTILSTTSFLSLCEEIIVYFFKCTDFFKGTYLVILFAFLILFLLGIFYFLLELNPSLISKRNENKDIDSMYFFQTIASKSLPGFKDQYRKTSSASDIEDLLNQLYINSKICSTKYRYTRRGIALSTIGLSGGIAMLIIGWFIVK